MLSSDGVRVLLVEPSAVAVPVAFDAPSMYRVHETELLSGSLTLYVNVGVVSVVLASSAGLTRLTSGAGSITFSNSVTSFSYPLTFIVEVAGEVLVGWTVHWKFAVGFAAEKLYAE